MTKCFYLHSRTIHRVSLALTFALFVFLSLPSLLHAETVPDPAQIERLVKQLGDDDWKKREQASEELKRIGLPARETLMTLLNHPDSEIAARVRRVLEEMPWTIEGEDDADVVVLLRSFSTESNAVRQNIIRSLSLLGWKKNLSPLVRIAQYFPSEEVAFAAVFAIETTAERTLDDDEIKKIAQQVLALQLKIKCPALALLVGWAEKTTGAAEASATLEKAIAMETQRLAQRNGTAAQSDNHLRDLKIRLATMRLDEGKTDECVRLFSELAKLEPDNINYELRLAELLLKTNHPKEFLAAFDSFKPAAKENRVLLYARAAAFDDLKQADESRKAQDAAFDTASSSSNKYETAETLLCWGRNEWARREYERILAESSREDFNYASAMMHVVAIWLESRQFEKAAQVYDKAEQISARLGDGFHVTMTEQDFKALALVARIRDLDAKNDTDKIRPLIEELAPMSSPDTDVAIEVYNLLVEKQRPEAAALSKSVTERLQVLEAESSAERSNNLAWFLARTNQRLDEALKLAEKAVALEPDNAAYLDTFAEVHFRLGNVEKAIRIESRVVKLAPDSTVLAAQLRRFKTEKPPR